MVPALIQTAGNATPEHRLDILSTARRVWDAHFYLGQTFDLALSSRAPCYALQLDDAGLEFFETSIRLYGKSRATYFNIARCRQRQRRFEDALAAVHLSLAADPSYAPASELRVQLEDSLAAKSRISEVLPTA